MRVTSDNGEFSAEVPAKYDFFYDKDGFIASTDGLSGYPLNDVHIFSGFHEKTLISFECYETGNSGAEAVVELDQQKIKASVEDRGAYKIKQYVDKNAEYYFVKQYFRSKNYLYVVRRLREKAKRRRSKDFSLQLFSILRSPPINGTNRIFRRSNFLKSKFRSKKIKHINHTSRIPPRKTILTSKNRFPSANRAHLTLMKPEWAGFRD